MRNILGVALVLALGLAGRGAAEEVTVAGQTRPGVEALPAFTVAGRLADVAVREGERVEAGQVLATLDATLAERRLDVLRAAADMDEEIALLELNATFTREMRRSAEQAHQAAAIGPAELTAARREANDAVLRLLAARREKKTADAEVALAEAELAEFTLKSPVAGWMARPQCRVGETLEAYDTFAYLYDTGVLHVAVAVPSRFAAAWKVEAGAKVAVAFPRRAEPPPGSVYSGERVEGTVLSVDRIASDDPEDYTVPEGFTLLVAIPNPAGRPAGETVHVVVDVSGEAAPATEE